MGKLTIDLSGPDGNAFHLLGLAELWAGQLGKDANEIMKRMKYSDYENLLNVFVEEFGDFAELKNRPSV